VHDAAFPTRATRARDNAGTLKAEKKRIAEEANAKRSEAAKVQHEVSKPYAGENMPEMVVGQTVPAPSSDAPRPGKKSKSQASNTNAGAVARGEMTTR